LNDIGWVAAGAAALMRMIDDGSIKSNADKRRGGLAMTSDKSKPD
jgi:hypothetical protein